jgi:tetratricopeptide (TPR) repeat protein
MGFVSRLLNSGEQPPDYWYRKGKELCTGGYYLDGLEALDKMTATEPLHADSWLLKGYAHYQMGQYEEAMQFFNQSLFINPQLHEALTYKGLILSNFGNHSEALGLYDRALAVNASYANAWYVKGLTLAILEQFEDAIRCYERALEIEPKHGDALAGISIAMKKREKTKHPHDTVAPAPQVPAEREHGVRLTVPAAPVAEITHATSPAGSSADMGKRWLIPAASLGDEKSAQPVKKPAAGIEGGKKTAGTTNNPTEIRSDLFESPVTSGDRGSAVVTDISGPSRSASAPELPQNAYEEKIRQHQESLTRNQDDPVTWTDIGDLSMKTGKYVQAAEAYVQALYLENGNARTWASLGDARKKTGSYDEADIAYNRSLEIDFRQGPVWINKAKTLTMLGRYEDAVHACRQAILINETDTDAWMYQGFLLKKMSRHSDALNAYDRVLAINPHHDHAMRQRRTLSDGV